MKRGDKLKINISKFDAPDIALKIKDTIDRLKSPEKFVLSLQLDYRDNNTLFYLNKVNQINFDKNWIEIEQKNNSHAFLDYRFILEYCVINAEDVLDLGVV